MNATSTPLQSVSVSHAGKSLSPASKLRSLNIAGPAGRLEAILNEGRADARFAALVCHPHPKGGGSMHNKVVYHAMKVMNDAAWGFGFPVLRFNFRGTGLSQGTHDGRLEVEDVQAAMEWLVNEYKLPLIVAGFSFGAAMALKACCDAQNHTANGSPVTRVVVAMGLPTDAEGRQYSYKFLLDCKLPKLFLSGDHDQYAPATQLAQVVGSSADPKRLLLVQGADHFFTNRLQLMQQALGGWLEEQLQ